MGNNYAFCNCKNEEVESEGNFKECNSQLENTNISNPHTNRHEIPFKTKCKQRIDIEKIKKTNAVNKIIKIYRAYKNKTRTFKYSSTNKDIGNYSSTENSSKLKQLRSQSTNKILTYIGDKKNGIKEGFGIQIWLGGAKYIGYYHNDKAEGFGQFIAANDKYEGQFVLDVACGYGEYYHSNGAIYEGDWKEDAQNNIGIETWKDGSCYKGEYAHGKKNGIGIYVWPDGSRYEGEWVDNSLNGYGVYYFTQNRMYLGEWKDNIKEGFGEFIWSDKKYMGFYVNDKKEGFGIYYWETMNKIFVGFWEGGKQRGLGKYMKKSKQIKYGIWDEDEHIKWIHHEEANSMMDNETIKPFKHFFLLSYDEVCKYLENNDIYSITFRE